MSEKQERRERPCLHCLIVELIGEFFAEHPTTSDGSDKIDTDEADEVIDAIAKTVAELTSGQDGTIRQQLIEHLMLRGGRRPTSKTKNATRAGIFYRANIQSAARLSHSARGFDDQFRAIRAT